MKDEDRIYKYGMKKIEEQKREKCQHKTVYSHENLASYINSLCCDHSVVAFSPTHIISSSPSSPSSSSSSPLLSPTKLPSQPSEKRIIFEIREPRGEVDYPANYPQKTTTPVVKELRKVLPHYQHKPNRKFVDLINGHCETVAIAFSERVLLSLNHRQDDDLPSAQQTRKRKRGKEEEKEEEEEEDILQRTYSEVSQTLKRSSVPQQLSFLFTPESRGRNTETNKGKSKCRQYQMWEPLLPSVLKENLSEEEKQFPHFLRSFFAGLSQTKLDNLEEIIRTAKENIFALPLYVANYIWDGDELTEIQMKDTKHETAMYSVHCIGLVVDKKNGELYLADPNGPLIPGASMEFFQIPFEPLPPSEWSTSISQYDRDHQ